MFQNMSSDIVFPNSKISSSQAGPISIEEIAVGPIEISRLSLTNFKGAFNYQSGVMKNLQLNLKISPYVDWWIKVSVDLGWPFGTVDIIDESGHVNLPSIDTGWSGLGDMNIDPGNMNMSIKEATFGPFKLNPAPIKGDISVRSINVNRINMINTKLPMTGIPAIPGLNLQMPNPMKPMNPSIQETQMQSFQSTGITLPSMTFSDIQALNVQMDQAQSGKLYAKTQSGNIPLGGVSLAGFAGVTLGVKIQTQMQADNLTFNDLNGNVTTDSAVASGFTMNLDINGIIMCYLKLIGYSMPTIEIEG